MTHTIISDVISVAHNFVLTNNNLYYVNNYTGLTENCDKIILKYENDKEIVCPVNCIRCLLSKSSDMKDRLSLLDKNNIYYADLMAAIYVPKDDTHIQGYICKIAGFEINDFNKYLVLEEQNAYQQIDKGISINGVNYYMLSTIHDPIKEEYSNNNVKLIPQDQTSIYIVDFTNINYQK